jgi:hypothetical protein
MNANDLLDDLLHFSPSSLTQLEAFAQLFPHEAATVSWAFLRRAGEGGRHVLAGYCDTIFALLHRILGKDEVELRLVREWASFDYQGRENILYSVLYDPALLSTSCALSLFQHPHSTLDDRMTILENLAEKRFERELDKTTLFECCDQLLRNMGEDDKERVHFFVMQVVESLT